MSETIIWTCNNCNESFEDAAANQHSCKPTKGSGKAYLGDGVYAEFDGWFVKLTTENGVATTNKIYLEPSVLKALRLFVEGLKTER